MTQELFDLLRRKGLAEPASLDSEILHRRTLRELRDLDSELADALHTTLEPDQHGFAGFDFWPNSELSASLNGCSAPTCRVERAERLARFAVMWSDSVYIPPYFGHLHDDMDELDVRIQIIGSVGALLAAEPAITAGIVKIAPIGHGMCPSCQARIDPNVSRVRRALRAATTQVHNDYSEKVQVRFVASPHSYEYWMTGPEDLLPEGQSILTYDRSQDKPPRWLPAPLRRAAEAGETFSHDVPSAKLKDAGPLTDVIGRVVEDVLAQHLACRTSGTKYLTHRAVDVDFLDAINQNDRFAAWNRVLAQHLEYEMPILNGVPLQDLIDLRTHDYEYFQAYRDTMKAIITDHLASRPAITGTEARDIYADRVRPQLNRMNQKLRSTRDKLSKKLAREVIVAGGVITLGLTTGIVAPELAAVGGAALAGKHALERRDASDELTSDKLYFLWKAAQKSRNN